MAEATNIGANPTQSRNVDFGGIMNQGLDRLAQNEARREAKAEAERKRNLEFEDRYGINEDDYVLGDTEFRTVNDATTEAVSLYRDRYYDVYNKLKQDPNNLDLKKRLGNISNGVKRMKTSHAKIQEIGQKYLEKMQNGELSGVDEDNWREILEATDEGRIKIRLDEGENMQILHYDKAGRLQGVKPYKELVNDDVYSKVDLDTELDGLVKRVGTDKIDVISGGFIKSINQFGTDQKRFVNDWIDAYVGTDEKSLETNPVLADLLNQATGGSSKKRSNFTEDERQLVKGFLLQQTKDRFNEELSIKQLAQPRATTAAEMNRLKADDINIAFDGGDIAKDEQGRFVFTIGKNVQIDPTKSDRQIDEIKADKNGKIWVSGQDRRKVKGVQPEDTTESIAAKEKVDVSLVESILGDDGAVQYYVRDPFTTDDTKVINKVGNMFNVQDELGLRNLLYQDMVSKFGQQFADSVITNSKAVSKPQLKTPTNTQNNSSQRLDAFGNPIED